MNFDFEKWCELNKSNPEEFEKERLRVLNEYIDARDISEENKQHLRASLFSSDQRLSKFKDPIARFNEVQRLFWIQVQNFIDTSKNPQTNIPNNIVKFNKK